MNAQEFMNFFRSEGFHSQMSAQDCKEVFLTVLKGGSDITAQTIQQLCNDYQVDDLELAKNILISNDYATECLWVDYDVTARLEEMKEEGQISKAEFIVLSTKALEIMNKAISEDDVTEFINDKKEQIIEEYLEELRS